MANTLRQELPDLVRQLAERTGAGYASIGRACIRQTGTLRQIGQDKWTRFTARQWIDPTRCAFRWRARVGLLGATHVEDALINGVPVGAVKALGLIPLQRAAPSAELLKGELMRYLAELAWVPDALLSNRYLDWQVLGERSLLVTAQIASVSASILLRLDEEGLPHRIEGLRPAREGDRFVERPWYGEFADFREAAGRCIPHLGKVGWVIDGAAVEVWRGRIVHWTVRPD